MVKSKNGTQTSEWRLKAFLVKKEKSSVFTVSFRIPKSLSRILDKKELSKEQKIMLVKSFADVIKNEDGTEQERIPDQHAVILIMALELDAI